jgi:hypothetical protein
LFTCRTSISENFTGLARRLPPGDGKIPEAGRARLIDSLLRDLAERPDPACPVIDALRNDLRGQDAQATEVYFRRSFGRSTC